MIPRILVARREQGSRLATHVRRHDRSNGGSEAVLGLRISVEGHHVDLWPRAEPENQCVVVDEC